MQRGAIILCGGKSTRMGRDKATLPFGPDEVMLQRVIRLLREATLEANSLVVVAACGQVLPPLPAEIAVARDHRPERGPLEGLAAGLEVLRDRADALFATSCDVPLLVPAFVDRMFELLHESADADRDATDAAYEIVVPREAQFHHPLAAVYRTSILPVVREQLAADRLRPAFLFDRCRTRKVPVEELRVVDPELATLQNCNRPEDYVAALAAAGLKPTLGIGDWTQDSHAS